MKPRPLKWTAKTGYAARGIVYFIVGGFAVVAALGQGGNTRNTKGALLELFDTGYGSALLTAVAAGLLCYAVWRVVQGVADVDDHGADLKGLTVRTGLLVSAITHTGLGFWALSAALGSASDDSGNESGAAAWLMQQAYGPWLVAAVGVCIVGAGIAHILKGVTRGYEKWFTADAASMKLIRPVATTGLLARGVVFLIVGGLFVYAGFTVDPQKAGGLREALLWLRGMPFGSVLFLVIAVGLVCFGAYSMLEAFYRRIEAAENLPDGAWRRREPA